jgi:nucleotide-binding universal stress UspA family protein
MNTILVPLDGSRFAELSLTLTSDLAKVTGANIVLVQGVPFFNSSNAREAAERAGATEAVHYLTTVQQRLASEGFTVQTETLPGNPLQVILFAALKHNADMIAMTTHGRTGIQSALLGSVARGVLQRSECPVLLVPARKLDTFEPAQQQRRILVPLDGSPLSEAALAHLAVEGLAGDAEIILYRVVTAHDFPAMAPVSGFVGAEILDYADAEVKRQRTLAEDYLYAAAERYLPRARWQIRVGFGNPASNITALAAKMDVSLIAMATAGRHGFDRLVHGSVAGQVLRNTPVPILLVHDLGHS